MNCPMKPPDVEMMALFHCPSTMTPKKLSWLLPFISVWVSMDNYQRSRGLPLDQTHVGDSYCAIDPTKHWELGSNN